MTNAPLLTQAESDSPRRERLWPLAIAVVIYAALSIWMAVASKSFLEADGITHYLARRFALSQPLHLVGVWSRPLCVAMYCIPARFGGLIGTRVMSLALVLLMLPLLWNVSRRLGVRWLTFPCLFLLTQPLLFAHSFSEMTEIPFAFLLLVMFWAYQARWFSVLACLTAIAPLGRPEGFGLLLIVGIALLLHRRYAWVLVLPMGLILWSYAGWWLFGKPTAYPWWKWLPNNWPYSPASVYGHGSIFWLIGVLPAVIGPVGFGFAVFGVWRAFLPLPVLPGEGWGEGRASDLTAQSPHPNPLPEYRERGLISQFVSDHAFRCRVLVALIALSVLVAHSILWQLGKMASNGEPRYLLIAAPFWAILSAIGLEWIVARFHWRRAGWVFIVAAFAPIVANRLYPCFPLGIQNDDRLTNEVTDWLATQPQLRERYPLLVAAMPHLFIKLDIDKDDSRVTGDPSQQGIMHPKPGELCIWDDIYSTHNSSEAYVVTQQLLLNAGWRPIARFDVENRIAYVYVSPFDKDGRACE